MIENLKNVLDAVSKLENKSTSDLIYKDCLKVIATYVGVEFVVENFIPGAKDPMPIVTADNGFYVDEMKKNNEIIRELLRVLLND